MLTKAVQESIHKHTGALVESKNITVKGSAIHIKAHSALKSEIYMHKQAIIADLEVISKGRTFQG